MSSYPKEPEPAYHGKPELVNVTEKPVAFDEKHSVQQSTEEYEIESGEPRQLSRALKNRHMQMIAIGGAIGAGLFVGSGGALRTGGPASLVICFMIIGVMLMFTMQALAELGVMFPVNGAFFNYAVRFVDPAWGFAMGWDYALEWLTVLPFEITAAGITLRYWEGARDVNIGVWITVFLVALTIIQIFGVRGYGEVEFVLSIIKITACAGLIILGIIIDCGGVPTQKTGYIGAKYWHEPGAFRNGFKGFCSVFVTASFAFGGTELSGLAAAEARNPLKSIPQATRQVFWRITFFYVVLLFIIGLIVPSDSEFLLDAHGANTSASPFVIAIKDAGIVGLPSVMNAVITISVLSVANSCAFASTRTLQALASHRMAPKFLAYIDKHGRPIWCVVLQLAFGLLAYVNEAKGASNAFFGWLLALGGLANFFVWGTICLSHIRFRAGWRAQGHEVSELPYKASFGIWGSYIGLVLNILCLIASFYVALFPIGGKPNAYDFFQAYLAGPLVLGLYLFWKVWSRDTSFYVRAKDMDVSTGRRTDVDELLREAEALKPRAGVKGWPMRVVRAIF